MDTEYTWRPVQQTDVDLLLALYGRFEDHHDLPFRADRAEVEGDLTDPGARLDAWSRCAIDSDGAMRGVGWVFHRPREGAAKHRALIWVIADPDHDHLENSLIGWCDETAAGVLAELDDGRTRVLRAWSPEHTIERIARFEEHGYHIARYFSTLSRPLAGAPAPAPPSGIDLVDWDETVHGAAVHEAHVEAFADHWGSIPADWESWQRDYVGDAHTRLDLSVVAVDGSQVVGYSLNQVWPDDAKVRGLTEGYLGAIGVRREWRNRGIATALILESMRRFAAEGFDNATLDTDTDSLTGAFELYTRLGFAPVDTSVTLIREL